MKIDPKTKNTIFQLSAILILLSAIIFYFRADIAKYSMIVGAAGYLFATFVSGYTGKDIRGKRLYNMQIFAAILMAVSAYLMFVGMNQWVITLLIASVLTLYSSIILNQIYRKESKNE